MHQKVGRNDLCPCGSGKKYKKCHELLEGPKKFTAQVISEEPGKKDQKLTSFFKRAVLPQATEPTPEEKTYDL